MTWRIELSDTNDDIPVVTVIKAQAIWKRLTVSQRLAVEVAWNKSFLVYGNPRTLRSLHEHGLITHDERGWGVLTEAGKHVARWNCKAGS
jgi:hypothetical protein